MASDALAKLWKQSEPRGPQRMVMAVLCDHCDYAGTVAMSQRAIARIAAMSKAAVAEAISRLVRDGHIKVLDAGGGHKHPSEYRLILAGDGPTKDEAPIEDDAPTEAGVDASEGDFSPSLREVAKVNPLLRREIMNSTTVKADPVAPDHALPATPPWACAPGHPSTLVGAILTTLHIEPEPGNLFWFRQEHKADAADLARMAGGEDALIAALRHVPAPKIPKGFRRLTALAGLVKEGRG